MHVEHPVSPIHHDRHYWRRIAIGTPTLMGVLLILALVGWCVFGCRADMAPRLWIHEALILPVLVFYGGLVSALGGGLVWFLGRIAFAFGDGIVAQWQHMRH